ncbi:MAG: flippase-like domain-containing protein [Myxococcota bacterium]|nr:flippase-like domain-containing protein [Myxococcota bacterium]
MSSPAVDFMKRHVRALLASVALAVGFGWVLRAGALPLFPPEGSLRGLNAGLVVAALLTQLVSMLMRLGRVHFLLAPIAKVSFPRLLSTLCITIGLITFLPFRLGEVARPALLREKGKLSGWAVSATVGAERIIDGVVFALLLLLGLTFAQPHEPLPDHIGNLAIPAAYVPRAAKLAAAGFSLAFLTMVAFFLWRDFARRVTERVLGLFSKKFAAFVADAVERVSEGLRFLPNLKYTIPYLLVTVVSTVLNIFTIKLLASAAGLPSLSFAQTTVVFGVMALGFAVPNAPGFFGAIQLALYAGLAVYVEPAKVVHEGAAFVFVYYLNYLGLVIAVTLSGLLGEYLASQRADGERAGASH